MELGNNFGSGEKVRPALFSSPSFSTTEAIVVDRVVTVTIPALLLAIMAGLVKEDELMEALYKMFNLGLSGMNKIDMTFSSDVLSVHSKSAPKVGCRWVGVRSVKASW